MAVDHWLTRLPLAVHPVSAAAFDALAVVSSVYASSARGGATGVVSSMGWAPLRVLQYGLSCGQLGSAVQAGSLIEAACRCVLSFPVGERAQVALIDVFQLSEVLVRCVVTVAALEPADVAMTAVVGVVAWYCQLDAVVTRQVTTLLLQSLLDDSSPGCSSHGSCKFVLACVLGIAGATSGAFATTLTAFLDAVVPHGLEAPADSDYSVLVSVTRVEQNICVSKCAVRTW